MTDLEAAVASWRAARYTVLADAVDAIAARGEAVAIAGRDKQAYQRAWLALARKADAAAIGALAAGLTRSVPVKDVSLVAPNRDGKRYQAFLDRLQALAALPCDPRIAMALCELLARMPFALLEPATIVAPAIAILVKHGDERSVPILRGLLERPVAKTATLRDHLAAVLPKAITAIERALAKREPLPVGTRAKALAQVPRVVAARPRELDPLLAECLANPDDDAPRLVYADALLEQGDPRGELIQLQLQAGDPKRAAALIRKHDKAWLGDLARITGRRVWRRGFLDEAVLVNHAAVDAATWARVTRDPLLATIRTLWKGKANEALYRAIVFSPEASSLRDIAVPSDELLRGLVTIGRPLDHVTLPAHLPTKLLDDVAVATGLCRASFIVTGPPERDVDAVAKWSGRERFVELCAIPRRQGYQAWAGNAVIWLDAHARLAPVRWLSVRFGLQHIRVERGATGVVVEIEAASEWALEEIVGGFAGRIELLTLRGDPGPHAVNVRLKRMFAELPAFEPSAEWAAALRRGRDPEPRARPA